MDTLKSWIYKSSGHLLNRPRSIFRFIAEYGKEYGVEQMCRLFSVSRSGYYRWLKRGKSLRDRENEILLKQIRCIHQESHQTYGSPRIRNALRQQGIRCTRKRIARLMRKNGIVSKTRKIVDKLKRIPSFGYKLLNQLSLPEDAHWTEYYKPLETRIQELNAKYKNDSEILEVLRKHQNEINMVKRNPKEFSSAFYIMQKL